TVARLAARLGGPRSDETLPPGIVQLREGNADKTVIFAHPTSGDLFCYLDLVPLLGARRVLGLSMTALGKSVATSVEGIATQYLPGVHRVCAGTPISIVGWSFGGLVAMELARALRASGADVGLVALIDTHLTPPDERFDARLFMRGLMQERNGSSG